MKGKIIVPLLLASVGAGVVATTRQQHTAYADQIYASDIENVVGDLVEITNFESSGTLGENVYLPTATAFDELGNPMGVALIAKVVDPSGRVLTAGEILTDAEGKYFVPKLKGYYSVSFATVSDDMKTETNALKIYVAGQDYSIVLPTNSKYVIPTTIPVSTKPLLIPAPKVMLDGDEVEDAIETGSEGLKVFVVNKNSSNTPVELAAPTKDADDNYYYSFVPSTAGVYEIVYKYIDGTVQDYKTQRFVVKDGYDISKMVLNFSYASSRPTSAILGQETALPKINIVNKTTNQSIEGYAEIVVEHMESGTKFAVEDYSFTPTLKGKYRISYTAKLDYFGLTSNTHTFVIEDVKDTVAPVSRAVNRYETNANGEITFVYDKNDQVIFDKEDFTDEDELKIALEKALSTLNYDIPSVVALTPNGSGKNEATISVPAIYGTDNFSKLKGLTFKRSVRTSATGVVTDIVGNYNEPATHIFSSAGNYTIRYIVSDEAGNEKMTSFDVKVVDTVNTLKKDDVFLQPTITMQALSAYMKADATLVFNAPTASDTYDTRVEVNTYYQFKTGATYTNKEKITQTNSNGQLMLNLKEASVPSNATELLITVEAWNDYSGVASTITRVVKLINTEDDNVPTFIDADQFLTNLGSENGLDAVGAIDIDGFLYSNVGDTFLGEPFEQKQTIVLPEVTIRDASDPNLEINVTVRDPFGKVTTLLNSAYTSVIGDTYNEFTVKNGKFVANYSGIYTVTYTAKDAGGNMVLKTFGIRVKDTEKPTIMLSSFDPFVEEMEVGKFIEVPAANLKDNGVIVEELTYGYKQAGKAGIAWRLENSSNASVVNGIGFTPYAAGEYVVIYEGWDAAGNETESRAYTVVVKDTLKPTIVLENDLYLSSGVEYVEGEDITIPGVVELYDGYRDGSNPSNNYDQTAVNDITLTVKVKDSSGNNVTVTPVNEQTAGGVEITRYTFVPTGHGVYTITYSAIDSTGNTTQITKTLEVGDVNAPDLVWADDYSIISTAKVGDTFELNMAKATISDDEDELEDIDKAVYMYAPDDTVVSNLVTNGYKWSFDKVGTYTLKITLTDSANNKETYTYSITVSEEEVEEETIAPWLGTTLIVATAVILAGVVVYFVVTSKNGKAKTTTKRRTTKK